MAHSLFPLLKIIKPKLADLQALQMSCNAMHCELVYQLFQPQSRNTSLHVVKHNTVGMEKGEAECVNKV